MTRLESGSSYQCLCMWQYLEGSIFRSSPFFEVSLFGWPGPWRPAGQQSTWSHTFYIRDFLQLWHCETFQVICFGHFSTNMASRKWKLVSRLAYIILVCTIFLFLGCVSWVMCVWICFNVHDFLFTNLVHWNFPHSVGTHCHFPDMCEFLIPCSHPDDVWFVC